MNVRDHFIPTNGITLHVAEAGDVGEPPVLWLHGLWDRWQVWESVASHLPGRHLMVELRGHGESDKPEGADAYRLADYAADITGLMDAFALPQATVAGFSLGGLVATTLAAQSLERVAGLIAVDPPYREHTEPFTPLADWRDLRYQSPDDMAVALAFLRPERTDAEREREAAWLRMTADGPFDALIGGTYGPFALADVLPAVHAPTLLLQADPKAGGALPDALADRAVSLLPNATLVRFSGSGHNIMRDQPDAFVAAVRGWMHGGESGQTAPRST